MIVNLHSYVVNSARRKIVDHLKSIRSRNKTSKSKAVASFIHAMEAGSLSDSLSEALSDANEKGHNGISRATLHRWWKAVEENTLSERYDLPEERLTVSHDIGDQTDHLWGMNALYKQYQKACRKTASGTSLPNHTDHFVQTKQEAIANLRVRSSQKNFLNRVLVGEVIIEFAERYSLPLIHVANEIAHNLHQHDCDISPFPAHHTAFENGPDWQRSFLAEQHQSIFYGNDKSDCPDSVRKAAFDKIKRVTQSLSKPDHIFIGNDAACQLFRRSSVLEFTTYSCDQIRKMLLEWVDEAKVPDLAVTTDLQSISTVEYAVAASRLYAHVELPFSKKRLRKMVAGGFSINSYFLDRDKP